MILRLSHDKDSRIALRHRVWSSIRSETIMGTAAAVRREPWNKGKIVGQKAPFKVKEIWALRVRLQIENRVRELALFGNPPNFHRGEK